MMSDSAVKSKAVDARSVRERVSREEWEVRCDLAAAYQLAALHRWTDLIYTHFSARVPGSGHLLINPYGLMFDEITASTLVKIDKDGNVVDDPTGLGVNYAGFVIHGCMHEARPEVNCVIHTHTRAGVAVSAQKTGSAAAEPARPARIRHAQLSRLRGHRARPRRAHAYGRDLGPTSLAMILRNHGLLTLGGTVAEAFQLMYYLDCACQIQIDALAGGRVDVQLISETTAQKGFEQFQRPGGSELEREWPALLRLLDRKGIAYRA